MTVSFYLLRKKSHTSSIMITICFHGFVFKAATGITCVVKNWSSKTNRVKKTQENHLFINRTLSEFVHHLNERLITYELSENDYTKYKIKEIFQHVKDQIIFKKKSLNNDDEGTEKVKENELLKHFEEFITARSNDPNYSNGIISNYKKNKKHLERFINHSRIDMTYDSIDNSFYTEFISYLSYTWNLQRNTVGNIIKTLKTFLNWSFNEGYHNNTRFMKILKVWKEDSDAIALTDKEIRLIEKLDLSDTPYLAKARDIFLICLFTGFRFSDYSKIQPAHINLANGEIRLITGKTKDLVGIPIDSRLEKVLSRYPELNLPKMSNQKVNEYIKRVAELGGLTDDVIKTYYIGNETQEVSIPKYDLISMHTARRTWNTKAEKSGRNTFAIMRATGHKNIGVHSGYVKYDLDDAIDEMRGMWD